MEDEIQSVKTFFSHLPMSDMFLESCIEWSKQEYLPKNYTLQDLQNEVYTQWLLLDFREMMLATLPPGIALKNHYILNGTHCLQLMQVVDISKPMLWQLQKIRNSNSLTKITTTDYDQVGAAKRMLKLTLTDGVQEIGAFEYRPIPKLSITLTPGSKIKIVGPVTVRRGELMLENRNVQLLGGQVDELLVSNAAENVLAKALNLPLNPAPGAIKESILTVQDETVTTSENVRNNPVNPPQLPVSQSRPQCPGNPVAPAKSNEIGNLSDDDDFFNEIDIDAHLQKISQERDMKHIPERPDYLTIREICELRNDRKDGIFNVKAKYKEVVEKLTVAEEYRILIKITDGTDDLVVGVHSDVISEFTGFFPDSILSLKKDIANNDKNATEKVMKALKTLKDKLVALDNVLELRLVFDQANPVIMKIL